MLQPDAACPSPPPPRRRRTVHALMAISFAAMVALGAGTAAPVTGHAFLPPLSLPAPTVSIARPATLRVPILMYHYIRVNPVPSDALGFGLSVTPTDFAAQMALLRAEGFTAVSLAEVRSAFDRGASLPPRPVVLTFDDGYADFANAAVPILQRNGFTATDFVISGFVGRSGYMNAAQLNEVAAAGMTVGAHTVDHPDLATLSPAAVRFEVGTSRTALQQLTGQPIDDFAYPDGRYNAMVVSTVQAAGFADAVTTQPGSVLNTGQRLTFPRVRVSGGESLEAFAHSVGVTLSPPSAIVPAMADDGYTLVARDGAMYEMGDAPPLPSLAPARPVMPIVGVATAGDGWWAAASDGGVFTEGWLPFLGSMGGARLNSPVCGIAATPSGGGYWLVARDGGVFAFGDAPFLGSMGGTRLNAPVVGMAATPSGRGYWLFAADGGVFAFGDAPFLGSMGGTRLNAPVVGATAQDGGYRMVAADGGVFSFGTAPFYGSMGGVHLAAPIVAMASTPSGDGYWLLGADSGVFTFGDAPYLGTMTHPI